VDDLEVIVFMICVGLAVGGAIRHSTGRLHPAHFRENPAPGIIRLGILLSMAWIAFVLWRFADDSVTGGYVVFYLIMGYAAIKWCGQELIARMGARTRVDAAERRNVPAALVAAAFILATGLIFGGSLWGEADPVGDDEGGFWIPLSFFLLGWAVLVVVFRFYLKSEGGTLAERIQRERSLDDARAAALFLLGVAIPLTDAVAGDFWGWIHGFSTFGVLAGMVIVHEVFAGSNRNESPVSRADGFDPRRALEGALYLALGAGALALNRVLDALLTVG
jgi:hypothetical protein